jgi:hypothetical protein
MTLSDRIKRWWNPGKWRDEHPEVSDGEDVPDVEQGLKARDDAIGEAFKDPSSYY